MLGSKFQSPLIFTSTGNILTTITGAISLISLIQRAFNVGLYPVSVSIISYYRKIAFWIFGFVPELLKIHIPSSLIDFWALSFICAAAYVRTKDMEQARAFRKLTSEKFSLGLRLFVFFAFGFTGMSLFIPLALTSVLTYADGEGDITRNALANLAWIIAACIMFFGLNAFAPSA
jgi:hypothetical protein